MRLTKIYYLTLGIIFMLSTNVLYSLKFGESCYLKYNGKYLTAKANYGMNKLTEYWGTPQCVTATTVPPAGPFFFTSTLQFTDTPEPGSRWAFYMDNSAPGDTLTPGNDTLCTIQNAGTKGYLHAFLADALKIVAPGDIWPLDAIEPYPLACAKIYGPGGRPDRFTVNLNNNSISLKTEPYVAVYARPGAIAQICFDAKNNSLCRSLTGIFNGKLCNATAAINLEIVETELCHLEAKRLEINNASLTTYGFQPIQDSFVASRIFAFNDNSNNLHIFAISNGDYFDGLLYKWSDEKQKFELLANLSPTLRNDGFGAAPALLIASELDMKPSGEILVSQGSSWYSSFVPGQTTLNNLMTQELFNQRINDEIKSGGNGNNTRLSLIARTRLTKLSQNYIPFKNTTAGGAWYDGLIEHNYTMSAFLPPAERLSTKSATFSPPIAKTNDTVSLSLDATNNIVVTVNDIATTYRKPTQKFGTTYVFDIEVTWLDKAGYIWVQNESGWPFYRHYSNTTGNWTQVTYLPPEFNEARQRIVLHGPNNTLYGIKLSQSNGDREILMHDGTRWTKITAPGVPLCISTDSEQNLYVLTEDNRLHTYQNNTWSTLNINLSVMRNPCAKFKIAGSPTACNIVMLSNANEAAVGTGDINSLTLKPILGINGITDITVSKTGQIYLIQEGQPNSAMGKIWRSNVTTALNTRFNEAELANLAEMKGYRLENGRLVAAT